ncbi:MAG: hypothetical protein MUE73_12970 [Planctomycetes bacterium]|jgi:hypothetical protein|nr:hypothetical protein [Planctomycetota bacterium]
MRITTLTVLVALFVAPGFAEEPTPPKLCGELSATEGLPVLTLWGEPRERGFAHGYLLAGAIVKGADDGLAAVLRMRPGVYDEKLRPLMAMCFTFSAGERAELEGILAGIAARLPVEERKVPALGREMDLTDLMAVNTYGDWYALGCSSAAVFGALSPDGKAAVVRNFDFVDLDLVGRSQHVRVVAPPSGAASGQGYVAVSFPGSIGAVTGLSGAGVFVAIHDVPVMPEMKDFVQPNVPRLVAVARLLAGLPAEGAVEKAAGLCRSWNTIFGNNFIVATPEPGDGAPAGVLEYDTREGTERGVSLRGPEEGASAVVCSNHHRRRGEGTCGRYDALLAGIAAAEGKAFDVPGLFLLGERSAVPAAGRRISDRSFGTLHQTVALCGRKRLYVRFAPSGGNIRDATPTWFDASALPAAAAAKGVR